MSGFESPNVSPENDQSLEEGGYRRGEQLFSTKVEAALWATFLVHSCAFYHTKGVKW